MRLGAVLFCFVRNITVGYATDRGEVGRGDFRVVFARFFIYVVHLLDGSACRDEFSGYFYRLEASECEQRGGGGTG